MIVFMETFFSFVTLNVLIAVTILCSLMVQK